MEAGDATVSIDLLVRSLLAIGATKRDIARAIVILGGSTLSAPSGYVLDGYGGLHQFGGAPAPPAFSYWPGRDIARDIAGY